MPTMKQVFIDGSAGTTGLRIHQRLQQRPDIQLITLPEEQRKDPQYRKDALNRADIAFLCLPDPAAMEAAGMIENENTVLIDTSTAHRTNPAWVYGFPELSPQQEAAVIASKRIAVPGCHAGGFIALVYPLVQAGILPADAMLTCHSLTGYSGGGKKMIAEYEGEDRNPLLGTPRQYGLSQQHKHLKEMQAITGLTVTPVFCPIVADFYSGMEVTVPLFSQQLQNGATMSDIAALYQKCYTGPVVQYDPALGQDGFLAAGALSKTDAMRICVLGNDDRILLTAVYDNLGKGASGAALECMNLATGQDKAFGLDI